MKPKKSFLDYLGLFKADEKTGESKLNPKTVGIILICGIGILGIMQLTGSKPSTAVQSAPIVTDTSTADTIATFKQQNKSSSPEIAKEESNYEQQLKTMLESISGVKNVTVMVNLEASDTQVLQQNVSQHSQITEESDKEGGKRHVEDTQTNQDTVIVKDGGAESPVVIKTEKAAIKGVLVIAGGVDNIQIKQMVIEAVTRVLGVGSNRVAVLPMKN